MQINGKKIRTIVSDFDGTLIRKGMDMPTKRFYDLLNICREKEILFVAASGRRYQDICWMFPDRMKEIVYISLNGSLVIYQDEVIYKACFEALLLQELLQDLQEEPGTKIVVSCQSADYILSDCDRFAKQVKGHAESRYEVVTVPDFHMIPEQAVKIAVYFPGGLPQETAERYHAKYDDRVQVSDTGYDWLDFNPMKSGKGYALLVVAEKLKLNLEQAISFGDAENDITMFHETGLSFVLDTAMAKVHREADYICKSPEDVIEYGLLQGKTAAFWKEE